MNRGWLSLACLTLLMFLLASPAEAKRRKKTKKVDVTAEVEEPAQSEAPPEASEETAIEDSDEADASTQKIKSKSGMVFGLAPGLYFEDSGRDGSRKVAINEPLDESGDYSSANLLSINAYLLFPLGQPTRFGFGLRYAGNYKTEPEGDDTSYSYGHMLDLYAQLEYIIDSLPLVDLILGARAGLSTLLPGGDFADEIDALQAQGVDVWSVPRLGGFIAPLVHVRLPLHENFALRGGLSFTAGRMFLFNTEQTVQGVPFAIDWQLNILRYGFTVGAEVAL
ncbi:MAG: hypothetical protein IPJ88_14525 [Myxococcales bacterium]|nr:MAG: hypothetical protein IPJ88_14525 [Myxococcales bacterium]